MAENVEHLRRYAEYIRNTGKRPLPCTMFDEDWEPVGVRVRDEMRALGLIEAWGDALMLTDKGEALANPPNTKGETNRG